MWSNMHQFKNILVENIDWDNMSDVVLDNNN